uniref:Uncharacterized protein n=1 Tax=Cacopsylla melanoneura TaxID=428564 RepID=A0A8D8V5E7_9HEMI
MCGPGLKIIYLFIFIFSVCSLSLLSDHFLPEEKNHMSPRSPRDFFFFFLFFELNCFLTFLLRAQLFVVLRVFRVARIARSFRREGGCAGTGGGRVFSSSILIDHVQRGGGSERRWRR